MLEFEPVHDYRGRQIELDITTTSTRFAFYLYSTIISKTIVVFNWLTSQITYRTINSPANTKCTCPGGKNYYPTSASLPLLGVAFRSLDASQINHQTLEKNHQIDIIQAGFLPKLAISPRCFIPAVDELKVWIGSLQPYSEGCQQKQERNHVPPRGNRRSFWIHKSMRLLSAERKNRHQVLRKNR